MAELTARQPWKSRGRPWSATSTHGMPAGTERPPRDHTIAMYKDTHDVHDNHRVQNYEQDPKFDISRVLRSRSHSGSVIAKKKKNNNKNENNVAGRL